MMQESSIYMMTKLKRLFHNATETICKAIQPGLAILMPDPGDY